MKNTIIYNVPLALFGVLQALLYIKPDQLNYFVNLFFNVDILLNAVTGGNGNLTISARVGFYANKRDSSYPGFWKFSESMINYTFLPVDGPNHCEQAREWALEFVIPHDKTELEFMHGPTWSLLLLSLIIIAACVLLIPLLRVAALLRIF